MAPRLLVRALLVAGAVAALNGCSGGDTRTRPTLTSTSPPSTTPSTPPTAPLTVSTATASTARRSTATSVSTEAQKTITISYRLQRHTDDAATAGFAEIVDATLADARGWSRAGFRFVHDDGAAYLIVLAEGDEVDRLCLPYDTYGRYSCQNGPVVALNAHRWRAADSKWTGDLPTYRQMLVNHEVGHLLGQKHPHPQCARAGQPAPVMNQQSTELNGCLPNPWPLPWEVELAGRHDKPLAPPPDR